MGVRCDASPGLRCTTASTLFVAPTAHAGDTMVAMLPGRLALDQSNLPLDAELENARRENRPHRYSQSTMCSKKQRRCQRPTASSTVCISPRTTRRCVSSCYFKAASRFIVACSMKQRARCAISVISTKPPSPWFATTRTTPVDVEVRVHDVWTLSPGFSFGRKGGENSTRLKFADTNFLGWANRSRMERTSDVDRTAWRLT